MVDVLHHGVRVLRGKFPATGQFKIKCRFQLAQRLQQIFRNGSKVVFLRNVKVVTVLFHTVINVNLHGDSVLWSGRLSVKAYLKVVRLVQKYIFKKVLK